MMKTILLVLTIFPITGLCLANTLNGFDLSDSLIPVTNITHGGPPRDGIPSIDDPQYVKAKDASFLKDTDIVFGLEMDGKALAFPRYILNWHELVNDKLGERSFLISYCPLCGSGMAFSSEVQGQQLIFGVSGLLYNSDLIFYDRNSESLWSQLDARAISGKHRGRTLQQLYLLSTSWSAWRKQHPDTKVLSEDQGVKRNYRRDPYIGYETSSRLFFKTLREAPQEFHPKDRVLGLKIASQAKAYPYTELRKRAQASFVDEFGGKSYRILWNPEEESARVESLEGKGVVTTTAFWFAWYAFNPDTEVFRAGSQ